MRKALVAILLIVSLLLLASCKDSGDTVSRIQYDNMYRYLSDLWAQSLSHADAQVAFFGDSRVAGANWYDAYPDAKVVNLGVGGDKVKDLITRLPLLDNLQDLSIVFVAIGGNDALSSSFDVETFQMQYDQLLNQLTAKGIRVYVNTITGICKGTAVGDDKQIAKANRKIQQANAVILALAAKHNIPVIDIASIMNNQDASMKSKYASDGVHFNEAGNEVWYEALRTYIHTAD